MAVHFEEFDVNYTDDEGQEFKNESQDRFLSTCINTIIPKAEKEGVQYVVLSGARGSGKSIGVEFMITWLAVHYPGIQVNLSRISIKEIKENLFKELKVMIPSKLLKVDNAESVTFINNSHVKCFGYGDGNVRKIRGNNCHVWVMEECTEDALKEGLHEVNKRALEEIAMVVRNPGAPHIVFILTNPEGPEHWLYEDFIAKAGYVDGEKTGTNNREENVHVFYSLTSDNPYLGQAYINSLFKVLSPKQAERYIYGRWVSLGVDGIYNEYNDEIHYHPGKVFQPQKSYPIHLAFDFNTAKGKPMSAAIFQYINDHFYFYDECVLENSNTRGVMEELEERGFFKQFTGTQQLIINGDATGWKNDSAAEFSDYGLIKQFIDHLPYKVNYKVSVPNSNPGVKERHKLVNSYLKNLLNEVRISVFPPLHDPKKVSTLHKGFKSTQLKKGSKYAEDDKNPNQHITTSAGYGIWDCTRKKGGIKSIRV